MKFLIPFLFVGSLANAAPSTSVVCTNQDNTSSLTYTANGNVITFQAKPQ